MQLISLLYRKIVISTRGTIDFEALFWAGTIQGRVQIKGGYNCQITERDLSNISKLREISTFYPINVDFLLNAGPNKGWVQLNPFFQMVRVQFKGGCK